MARLNDESDPDDEDNPFSSPRSDLTSGRRRRDEEDDVPPDVKGKVLPPAICLTIVASLGLLMSIVNVVWALASGPPVIDPTAPKFVQDFQRGGVGAFAAVIQSGFIFLNLLILVGAIQMMRLRNRVFAIASSIMAMLNFGTCCCLLGLPVGIWSLIILMRQDVIAAFEETAD